MSDAYMRAKAYDAGYLAGREAGLVAARAAEARAAAKESMLLDAAQEALAAKLEAASPRERAALELKPKRKESA